MPSPFLTFQPPNLPELSFELHAISDGSGSPTTSQCGDTPPFPMVPAAEAETKASDCVGMSPPSTPRKTYCPYPSSPPPAPMPGIPKFAVPFPPLMKALHAKSVKEVREVLLDEPDAPQFPFWDHETEPPLCYALKHKCSAGIVRLLVQHGADTEMKDVRGKSPADLLRSARNSTECYPDIGTIEQILGVVPDNTRPNVAPWAAPDMLPRQDFLLNGSCFDPQRELAPWARLENEPAPLLLPTAGNFKNSLAHASWYSMSPKFHAAL